MSRDLTSSIDADRCIRPRTLSTAGGALTGAGVDLQFFESATVLVEFGDIDEMGGSPVGAARIDIKLEHSDDNSVWSDITQGDVIGPTSVTNGIVAAPTTDANVIKVGYRGSKRYLRVILTPTALTNGGPVTAIVVKGSPRHAPQ